MVKPSYAYKPALLRVFRLLRYVKRFVYCIFYVNIVAVYYFIQTLRI